MTTEAQPTTVIDARGKSCPGPVIELRKGIRSLQTGDTVELLATDKGSMTDIPAWAEETGHELLSAQEEGGVYHFLVKKAE